MASTSSVKVALRVRPLSATELINNNTECVACLPDRPEILLGADRSFVFDHVFDPDTEQKLLYQESVQPLVNRFLDGFNATVLAYGQTGSGKTYSMGTGLDTGLDPQHRGVIPRAVDQIFEHCEQMTIQYPDAAFEVRISFLELYNEDLIDLLMLKKPGDKPPGIREDGKGGIEWVNVKQVLVKSPEDVFALLKKGSLCRTTGSTDMNMTSSRSHAVFSIKLQQRKPVDDDCDDQEFLPTVTAVESNIKEIEKEEGAEGVEKAEGAEGTGGEDGDNAAEEEKPIKIKPMRTLVSKFHFVDLAGSERLKRTNATGSRKKEGIAINAGLLALGNVISALCENASRNGKKENHVPYRDSKLTRLLQDSLGGNRYASRARKIQNRARVNMDDPAASAEEVKRLRKQLARMQIELDNIRNNMQNGQMQTLMVKGVTKVAKVQDQEIPDDGKKNWLESQLFRVQFENSRLNDRVRELEAECTEAKAERDSMLYEKTMQREVTATPDAVSTDEGEQKECQDETEKIHPMVGHYVRSMSDLESRLRYAQDELAYWRDINAKRENASEATSRTGTSMDIRRKNDGAQSPFVMPIVANRAMSRTPQIMDINRLREEIKRERQNNQGQKSQELGTSQLSLLNSSDSPMIEEEREPCNVRLTINAADPMDLPPPDEMDDEEYLEEMLRRINASIVMKEGLMQQIEQLQDALTSKEDLVLEMEEARYVQSIMEEKYLEKIEQLQEQLIYSERERDELLKKVSPVGKDKFSPEVRHQYEEKMKILVNEISGLRKETNTASRNAENAQKQNLSMIRAMTQTISQLKSDKQRMAQRMKELEDRSREIAIASQKELQSLRRKERLATEAMQKLERQNEMQKIMLKRQQEENIIMSSKLKQMKKNFEKLQQQMGSGGNSGSKTSIKVRTSLRIESNSKKSQHRKVQSLANLDNGSDQGSDSSMSGIRATFKKQLLEREVSLSVAKRQIASVLEELISKYDRLLEEKQALLEERDLIVQEEAEIGGVEPDPSKPQYMDDRLELIDAEAAFTAARVRGLRLEAAQMNLAERGAGPLGRDAGYENALAMLSNLSVTDSRRMLRHFLDDVIRLRVEHWSRQMTITEMEKGMMDLRRTLLVLRKTAVTAAAEYENKLREIETKMTIIATSPTISVKSLQTNVEKGNDSILDEKESVTEGDEKERPATMESTISDRSSRSVSFDIGFDEESPANVFERIYERGILNRAVRSIEERKEGRRRAFSNRSEGAGSQSIYSASLISGSEAGDSSMTKKGVSTLQKHHELEEQFFSRGAPSPTPSIASELGELRNWWTEDAEHQLQETEDIIKSPVNKTRSAQLPPKVIVVRKRRGASESEGAKSSPLTHSRRQSNGVQSVSSAPAHIRRTSNGVQSVSSASTHMRRISDGPLMMNQPNYNQIKARRRLSDGGEFGFRMGPVVPGGMRRLSEGHEATPPTNINAVHRLSNGVQVKPINIVNARPRVLRRLSNGTTISASSPRAHNIVLRRVSGPMDPNNDFRQQMSDCNENAPHPYLAQMQGCDNVDNQAAIRGFPHGNMRNFSENAAIEWETEVF